MAKSWTSGGKFEQHETEEQTWRKVWQNLPSKAGDFRSFLTGLKPLVNKEKWRFAVSTFEANYEILDDPTVDDSATAKAQMIYDELLLWTRMQKDWIEDFLESYMCTNKLCRMVNTFKKLRDFVLSEKEPEVLVKSFRQKHPNVDSSFLYDHANVIQLMIYDVDDPEVKDEEKNRRQGRMRELNTLLGGYKAKNALSECDLPEEVLCSLFTKAVKVLTEILGEDQFNQLYETLIEGYKISQNPQDILQLFGDDVSGRDMQDYNNSFTNLVYVFDKVKETTGSLEILEAKLRRPEEKNSRCRFVE
ncbi:unnamed protein product, partial [Mesorhabditis belari]|uniref:Uncharacterized protein n=1 Tax=Mesorhabditis belari TaxID=2138241 RepID=A0AAF3FRE6_9BILA